MGEMLPNPKKPKSEVALALLRLKNCGGNPMTWIELNSSYFKCPLFVEILLRIHSLCPHACSVERVNKVHKLVKSKVRNRLSDVVVKMLLFCYVNMRMTNREVGGLGDLLHSALADDTGDVVPITVEANTESVVEGEDEEVEYDLAWIELIPSL
eukprot:gene21693-26093_t